MLAPTAAGVGPMGFGLGGSDALGGATGSRSRLVPPAEALLRDRFGEFQRLAREKNTLPSLLSSPTADRLPPEGKKTPKGGFMRDFFDCVGEIQGIINAGRKNVELMGEILEDTLQATTQDRQSEASDRLQRLVQETNGHISLAKAGLEALKRRSDAQDAKKPNSAESKIRTNMQTAMARKHHALLLDFQKAQVDYKRALEQRQRREMEILMPHASPEEREEMIEAGETTTLVVAKKMAGAHALLLDEVQRIREKHQDIMRLEASIADLAQMFQEMAVLVEAQGEMLDAIEININKTKDCTAKAEKELVTTRKEQHKNQKWMCCISLVLMIVILVILGPVLIKNGG